MNALRNALLAIVVAAASLLAAPSHARLLGDDHSYRAGIGLLNKGLSDLAAAEFRKYLEENPDGAEAINARYSLAVCLTRLGKHQEAAKELERVIGVKGFEFAPDSILLKAQCSVAAGDDVGAAEILAELGERYPKFAQLDRAAAMRGESLYRLGQYKEAQESLALVASKWPTSPVAERTDLFAAMTLIGLGDLKAGAQQAARLRERAPKGEYAANAALIEGQCRQQLKDVASASKLFELASKGTGEVRAEALLGLAAVSRAQGDLKRAEQALGDAEKESLSEPLRAWMMLEKGKLLFQRDDLPAAGAAFASAQKSGPDATKAEAAYWFAKCQIKQGKYEEAAANLEHAAERFPSSDLLADMLFERAAALSKGGDDEGALEAWEQWGSRFSKSDLAPDAMVAQAWCAHRIGKLADCEKLCKAIADARGAPASSESFELLMAENAFAQQHFDVALGAYGSFVEHHAKSQHAWRAGVWWALCLVSLGRADEAAPMLQASLAAEGNQDPALRRAAITSLADSYFSKSEWPKAEAWFARLAADNAAKDQRSDALLRQGICIERQRRFADALPLFEEVAKQSGDAQQARQAQFERGQSLLELGRLDEAKAALEPVAKKDSPFAPHALRHLATIASKQGHHEEAAVILAKLSDSDAGVGPAATKLELGSALLAAGKYEQAEAALSEFLQSAPTADAASKAAVLRAIAINRQGRHEDAAKNLQAHASDASLDPETRASGKYELAVALRSMGNDDQAAAVFREVLKGTTPRLEAYAGLDLAQIESKAKHYDKSLELLEKSVSSADGLDKADAAQVRERAAYLRAACLLQMNKPKEAAQALAEFATTYPKSPLLGSVYLVRGEALLASGQAREAAEQLSLAAASDQPAENQQSALLRLGEALAASQDWSRSEQAFTTFLDRFSDSPLWFQARFGQGWARENQGRQDTAIEAYRDVVARHTGITAARAQFQIGECLYAQKKHEPAVAELLKTDVLFAYPDWSAAALYEAGRCLGELNRPDDASKQFDDLIKRFPDSKWAKLAADKRGASAPASLPGRAAGETRSR
jgi:TolA-binding protein